jgi:hypothetical protein
VLNVIEWMAVVNLSRYVEIFKRTEIKGEDLLMMNEAKLEVRHLLLHSVTERYAYHCGLPLSMSDSSIFGVKMHFFFFLSNVKKP